MALTRIPAPAIADVREPNFRNIIINGDMAVAQRGTSTSSVSSGSTYVVDRTFVYVTNGGTWTMSQDTAVPSGSGFAKSIKLDCTTADASLGAADYIAMQQRIEGQNLQYIKKGTSSAESLTLSFWVYATKTGTNICELYDADNTRQISKSYTVNTTNTWEKKTITFAGDTSGTLDNDNATSMTLLFWLGAGSNFTSGTLNTSWGSATNANRAVGQVNHADSTSNNFYITGIQLEAGSVATDFEVVPYDVNLQRCYRYYYLHASGSGPSISQASAYNTNDAFGIVFYKTSMRTTPTLSTATGTNYYSFIGSGTSTNFNGPLVLSQANTEACQLAFSSFSGALTQGDAGGFRMNNGSALIAFAAEL